MYTRCAFVVRMLEMHTRCTSLTLKADMQIRYADPLVHRMCTPQRTHGLSQMNSKTLIGTRQTLSKSLPKCSRGGLGRQSRARAPLEWLKNQFWGARPSIEHSKSIPKWSPGAPKEPPDPLQIASKMLWRRPRKAKSRSSTTRVAQNPILETTSSNRTFQRHPKMGIQNQYSA